MNITMIKAGLLAGVLALGLAPVALAQPAPVGLPPPARTAANDIARLDTFDFAYVLEWSGDNVQFHLKLARQADGSYLADVDGEEVAQARKGVRVEAAQLADLLKTLSASQKIPDDGFGGDGNHFYTQINATGQLANGKPLAFDRFYYDMNDARVGALAGALNYEVEKLVKALAPAPAPTPAPAPSPAPSAGLSGSIPR